MIPPSLALSEHIPTPMFRTCVGYSSAVYRYSIPKAAATENFPMKAAIMPKYPEPKKNCKCNVIIPILKSRFTFLKDNFIQ